MRIRTSVQMPLTTQANIKPHIMIWRFGDLDANTKKGAFPTRSLQIPGVRQLVPRRLGCISWLPYYRVSYMLELCHVCHLLPGDTNLAGYRLSRWKIRHIAVRCNWKHRGRSISQAMSSFKTANATSDNNKLRMQFLTSCLHLETDLAT